MHGQTCCVCTGQSYRYNREHDENCGHEPGEKSFTFQCAYVEGGSYENTECAAAPHGTVVYSHDLNRYIEGGIAKAIWD
jgi:hypothetical protein